MIISIWQVTLKFTSLPGLASSNESYRCVVGTRYFAPAVAVADNSLGCFMSFDATAFVIEHGINLHFASIVTCMTDRGTWLKLVGVLDASFLLFSDFPFLSPIPLRS